jgi:hypothetical protein
VTLMADGISATNSSLLIDRGHEQQHGQKTIQTEIFSPGREGSRTGHRAICLYDQSTPKLED